MVGDYLDLRAAATGIETGIGIEVDVLAGDGNAVVGVDVSVDLCLRLAAAADRDRVDARGQGATTFVELADGAVEAHHPAAAQADGAALGGVDDGAV